MPGSTELSAIALCALLVGVFVMLWRHRFGEAATAADFARIEVEALRPLLEPHGFRQTDDRTGLRLEGPLLTAVVWLRDERAALSFEFDRRLPFAFRLRPLGWRPPTLAQLQAPFAGRGDPEDCVGSQLAGNRQYAALDPLTEFDPSAELLLPLPSSAALLLVQVGNGDEEKARAFFTPALVEALVRLGAPAAKLDRRGGEIELPLVPFLRRAEPADARGRLAALRVLAGPQAERLAPQLLGCVRAATTFAEAVRAARGQWPE